MECGKFRIYKVLYGLGGIYPISHQVIVLSSMNKAFLFLALGQECGEKYQKAFDESVTKRK